MEELFSAEDLKRQGLIILHVFIAAVLAGIVGYEREAHHKPAGLRTNMIIAAVAVLLVSLAHGLAAEFATVQGIQIDPLRIIEAMIVGVSFIGAGTIIKAEAKADVQNLTTAATLLFSASIGLSVALQQYVLAVGVTVIALFINYGIKRIMLKVHGPDNEH